MDEVSEFVDLALEKWREKRDQSFISNNLNRDEVYVTGDFESLPAECLIAVCYVDAYACVQANIRSKDE
ncbi:hypothetical protein ABEW24_23905 [Paenibacillus jamilae]|uniref:hypothetical protein n=1 Tax=Paenibacillus TaxID=44249 RepID=UPI00077C8F22|nr:hypothetical protein [Paenibacillus polymyxa]KYG95696.1 hypothetical protein AZE31_18120 [Paenibacillus polymyxa]